VAEPLTQAGRDLLELCVESDHRFVAPQLEVSAVDLLAGSAPSATRKDQILADFGSKKFFPALFRALQAANLHETQPKLQLKPGSINDGSGDKQFVLGVLGSVALFPNAVLVQEAKLLCVFFVTFMPN